MASMREIKRRKTSIQSTAQITKAMKLVSTVKFQKAKVKAETTRPYFDKMYETVSSILSRSGNIHHRYLMQGESQKRQLLSLRPIAALPAATTVMLKRLLPVSVLILQMCSFTQ